MNEHDEILTEKEIISEETNKENIYNSESQLKWILLIIGFFVVALIVGFFLKSESNSYDYAGVIWQKEMFGQIPLHSTVITGYSVSGTPIDFKMNFRGDPRKNKVPIEGELDYILNNPVYISIDLDSGISECGTLALVNFGRFMAEMRFQLESAVPDENLSIEYGKPIANCENRPESTVFILRTGDQSKIVQDKNNPNCYELIVANCEDIEVMERLQVATIARFTSQPV
jgi:hypothetical protein